jgi:hypothetical protein
MKEILLKSVAGPNVHPACSDECVLKNMLQKNITLVVRMAEYAVGTTLAVELFDMVVDWTLSAEGIPFKHVRDAEGRWQLRNCPCSSKAMLDDLQFNVERAKVIGLTKKGSSRLPDPNVIPIICSYIKI